MSDKPQWKKALREPNVPVWIAFLLMALGVGVGTMMFGGPHMPAENHVHAMGGSSAAYHK